MNTLRQLRRSPYPAKPVLAGLLTLLLTLSISGLANACPFCAAVSQTFSEEIDSMDAVVIARMVEAPKTPAAEAKVTEVPKARFRILHVLKGDSLIDDEFVQTAYFGQEKLGTDFLIMGVDPPKIMWSTPFPVSERAQQYLKTIIKLPKEGKTRLEFFQKYLEDKDEDLARDAYDEFAKAPYESVQSLKEDMDHDQLVAWIQNDDIPASRRRLYLTMLGVCGGKDDLPLLESLLRSKERRQKAGLDALIACYLTLRGPEGVELIEDLFLKNKDAEYADTYAAIMALRFHGTESDIIPRERLLKALRHMLDRPQLADLVIPDLARWEDWTQMERLVKLFKDADEKSSWVRVPVINYLRACPDPKSEEYIEELKKIDPAAVKRANTFFPFGAGSPPSKKTSRTQQADEDQVAATGATEPAREDSIESADADEASALAAGFEAMRAEAQEGNPSEGNVAVEEAAPAAAEHAQVAAGRANSMPRTQTPAEAFWGWVGRWSYVALAAAGLLMTLGIILVLASLRDSRAHAV